MKESGTSYILEMKNITKQFPGILANDHVNLQLKKQEIHALLGENGAGKSTLMSILFGLYKPDEGEIFINGEKVTISNPNDANKYHIGMVHQHFKLVNTFTALQNIILGVENCKNGFLKMDEAKKKVIELSERYEFNINPDMLIQDMTVGMQQRVEILKMLYRDNDILIFDEPTAVLTPQEIDELMKIMRNLVNEGKSILFITHKLNEIMENADRCTILRKGQYVETVDVEDVTKEELSEKMVGRKVNLVVEKTPAKPSEVVLCVKNLCVYNKAIDKDVVKNVSFDVKAGEICCIAGIDGNGQTELVHAIAGMREVKSGEILFRNELWNDKSIRYRNTHGMAHIPEDRHKHGLVLDYTISENIVLQTYFMEPQSKHGILDHKVIQNYANELIEKYDVRGTNDGKAAARSMSGGNQQKAIVARELEKSAELLIAVQPTRGLDVGAIEYIHKKLVEYRDSGKAVLLVSLELDEVMDVSDRILVIHDGEIMGELDPKKTNHQEIGLYMVGAKRGDCHEN